MTYDFFADLWNSEKIEDKFRDLINDGLNKIKRKKDIRGKINSKELVESLESDTTFFDDIVRDHLGKNSLKCETLYQKLLFILRVFVISKDAKLKEEIHRILQEGKKEVRSYKEKEIDEMDISENPRNAYKKFFMNYAVPRDTLDLIDCVSLGKPTMELKNLPRYSFFLSVRFVLQKPFISKDDEGFYIHDNPISKEKIFKVPYVRASSWKGGLRQVFRKLNKLPEDDERILRVFGNEKGEEAPENLRKGRLYTYPTFFDQISLDIINPHDRVTKTGKNPITLEVVPKNAEGDLCLLYVPFDKIGEDDRKTMEEVEIDLLFLCKAVRTLLAEYGMSAKRTSGYGSAKIEKITFRSVLLREYEKYTDLEELIDDLTGKYPVNTSPGGDNGWK